jgi:hypothetical protein
MDFDLARIKTAVLNQLMNANGLYSLKIQNHIYGCFIIMEDIIQNTVDFSGTVISTPNFSFDLNANFSDIGVRYGFIFETSLTLDKYLPEYKEAWLQYFKDVSIIQDISQSDAIEDAIIEIIQTHVPTTEAFLMNSLETGSLSQEWVDKVLSFVRQSPSPPHSPDSMRFLEKSASKTPACLEKHFLEKSVTKNAPKTRRTTRRVHLRTSSNIGVSIGNKSLAKTRRNHVANKN